MVNLHQELFKEARKVVHDKQVTRVLYRSRVINIQPNSGLPLIIHLKIPWLFPDTLQFSIPSDRSKKLLLFFTLMVLTVSLQIWGYS